MEELLKTVSYDQYTDFERNKNSSIVFSDEIWNKIKKLIKDSCEDNKERGCYFVGKARKVGDKSAIYVDYASSDFEVLDDQVNITVQAIADARKAKDQYLSQGFLPFIFHFHTHPNKFYFECFSDQDLLLYANQGDSRNTNFSGAVCGGLLAFPAPNCINGINEAVVSDTGRVTGFGLSCVYTTENYDNKAKFFMIPPNKFYYTKEDRLYNVGCFEKKYSGRRFLPRGEKSAIRLGIVQNPTRISLGSVVCCIGCNPNTSNPIKDECVGTSENIKGLFGGQSMVKK